MSVYRHGRCWWYDFVHRGVRYRERTSAATQDAALQLEATRKAEVAASTKQSPRNQVAPRFSDFAYGEFQEWCAVEHKDRPSTFARYMRNAKSLNKYFGHRTLQSINAGDVERYKIHRSQQKRKNARDGRLVSPAAVNRDLAVLRILFNYAKRLGIVDKNPVSDVRFFRERQNHMPVLSPEEEQRYLAATSPLLRDVAVVMLETGMRPGEIYRLRKQDIDLDLGSVHVRSGKTANAARFIPLTPRAVSILKSRMDQDNTEWLFPCPFDFSKHVLDVRKAHDAAVRRAGIEPPLRLYDLRHTALTRMAMSGIDLPTLKELAGHSQIQMTMRYVHPTPEHKRRAIEKFAGFTSSRAPTKLSSLIQHSSPH